MKLATDISKPFTSEDWNDDRLSQIRRTCALTLLELYRKANAEHIGSSLSCLEILIDLYFRRMKKEDLLILSKGHAATALYTVLAEVGRISRFELSTYYLDRTLLGAHPSCSKKIYDIPFGTGYVDLSSRGSNRPRCLIAQTVKGHGVSYMENKMKWHYNPMSEEQYEIAVSETRTNRA